MSNQSERTRRKSKHKSSRKHNSLMEVNGGYGDVPFTPKGEIKDREVTPEAGFTAFGFDALRLKDALMKIDQYKQVQRVKEREKKEESPMRESQIPTKREDKSKISVSVKETPKRQYSSEVVSALLQYKLTST